LTENEIDEKLMSLLESLEQQPGDLYGLMKKAMKDDKVRRLESYLNVYLKDYLKFCQIETEKKGDYPLVKLLEGKIKKMKARRKIENFRDYVP